MKTRRHAEATPRLLQLTLSQASPATSGGAKHCGAAAAQDNRLAVGEHGGAASTERREQSQLAVVQWCMWGTKGAGFGTCSRQAQFLPWGGISLGRGRCMGHACSNECLLHAARATARRV
jgi:hypothetical protein